MPRTPLTHFSRTNMKIDYASLSNLVITQKGYMYTCIMDLRDKTIYIASLEKPELKKDDHYGTVTPVYQNLFPCVVLGKPIHPILHKSASSGHLTSHHQLANLVIRAKRGNVKEDIIHFCGFSLRYDGPGRMSLSPTSRTLNPGYNGTLEPIIMREIANFISPKLKLLKLTLESVGARITPDIAQAKRGKAIIPKGMLSQITQRK